MEEDEDENNYDIIFYYGALYLFIFFDKVIWFVYRDY